MRLIPLAVLALVALASGSTIGFPGDPACDPSGSQLCAPKLTLTLAKSAYTDCDPSAQVNIDLGTQRVDTLFIHIVDSEAQTAHESIMHGGVYGPTVYHAFGFTKPDGTPWAFGTYTVTATAFNAAGPASATTTFPYSHYVDTTPPATAADISSHGSRPPVDGWYTSAVRVMLTSTDDCRSPTTLVKVNGSPSPTYFHLREEGPYFITYQAVDAAGNEEALQERFIGIDLTPPQVSVLHPAPGDLVVLDEAVITLPGESAIVIGPVTLRADAHDAASGVTEVAWVVDGAIVGYGEELPYLFTPGEHTVVAVATDLVGHESTSDLVRVRAL